MWENTPGGAPLSYEPSLPELGIPQQPAGDRGAACGPQPQRFPPVTSGLREVHI